MNLRQLRYFVKILEAGNMTRAAEQLRVAQPALGVQIVQLEDDLGVKLLTRHSRGVVPTPAGEKLFERAVRILRDIEEARTAIKQCASASPEFITMGLASSVMLLLGAEVLRHVRESVPSIALSLIEQPSYALVEGVAREEIDVAVASETVDQAGMIRTPLLTEELLFITAADADQCDDPVSLAEVLRSDLAMAGSRDPCRQLIELASQRVSTAAKVAYEVQSLSTMKDLVSRKLAACILPLGSVHEELSKGILKGHRIYRPTIKRTLYLLRSRRRPSFQNEHIFQDILSMMLSRLAELLGPLASVVDEEAAPATVERRVVDHFEFEVARVDPSRRRRRLDRNRIAKA